MGETTRQPAPRGRQAARRARPNRRPVAGLRGRHRQLARLPTDDRYAQSADSRIPQGQAPRRPAAAGTVRRPAGRPRRAARVPRCRAEYVSAFDIAETEAIRRRRSDFSEATSNGWREPRTCCGLPRRRRDTAGTAERLRAGKQELDGLIALPAAARAASNASPARSRPNLAASVRPVAAGGIEAGNRGDGKGRRDHRETDRRRYLRDVNVLAAVDEWQIVLA